MSIFTGTPTEEASAPAVAAEPTLQELLDRRDEAFAGLVGAAAGLVQEASDLRARDNAIARAFRDTVFENWRAAVTNAFDAERDLIMSHLAELRDARELSHTDPDLAISKHSNIIRAIRQAEARRAALKKDRPTGPDRVSQSLLSAPSAGVPRGETGNLVGELMAILLPSEGHEMLAERIVDVTSRLNISDSGVPADILSGPSGHEVPPWHLPVLTKRLAAIDRAAATPVGETEPTPART